MWPLKSHEHEQKWNQWIAFIYLGIYEYLIIKEEDVVDLRWGMAWEGLEGGPKERIKWCNSNSVKISIYIHICVYIY